MFNFMETSFPKYNHTSTKFFSFVDTIKLTNYERSIIFNLSTYRSSICVCEVSVCGSSVI